MTLLCSGQSKAVHVRVHVRVLCAGVSQGSKDRYFLSPEGKCIRTRAEAEKLAWTVSRSRALCFLPVVVESR